ncbi:MAG: signal peptidase I [Dehalococcoidia bacterium]|nr:signal peptidase I [Dehalococcoidia bacterium]
MTTDDPMIEFAEAAAFPPPFPEVGAAFSHGGLVTVDPWEGERRPLREALWPWGLRGLAETLEVIALAMIMFVGVRAVAHNYRVEGSSMVPTFQSGEALIVNRLAYRTLNLGPVPFVGRDGWQPFGAPQQGDVVIFVAQRLPRERDFVKRIIALPGQSVAVRSGRVSVDGVAYDEPYILAPPTYEFNAQVVPPGKLFVLGDNRNNSQDSHLIGMVNQSEVVGRVDLRYWPLRSAQVIRREFGTPADPSSTPASSAPAPAPRSMRLQPEVSLFP